MRIEEPKEKARQGRTGRPVLIVLLAGLVLALVVWGLVEIYGMWITPETPIGDPQTPPGTEEIEPAD